jgi:hypothetical protein
MGIKFFIKAGLGLRCCVALLILLPFSLLGQTDYQIPASVIDAGGGKGSSSSFGLISFVGEAAPDGISSNEDYEMGSGFKYIYNLYLFAEEGVRGDANGDGSITPGDALCAFWRSILGSWQTECESPGAETVSDINCDGNITPGDALCIFWRSILGDWPEDCVCEPLTKVSLTDTPVRVRIGSVRGNPLEVVRVPIWVDQVEDLDAFGMKIVYPADLLEFQELCSTGATREWTVLDGVVLEPGILSIGGFHTEGLTADHPVSLIELVFTFHDKVEGGGFIEAIHLTDDMSSAEVSKGHVGVKVIPTEFTLSQNYPNPFNPTTTIDYALAEDAHVTLEVYNLLGQVVAVLVDDVREAGNYRVSWDASGIASGIYLYRVQANEHVATRRMVLMK